MSDLAHVLRHVPIASTANLLLGNDMADDAAIYRLSDELALVQSVDFLTPIVDDPYTFGRIAAANALSDIYAVGGRPLTALNVVSFPIKTLRAEILAEILRGGAEVVAAAGAAIVGGHTVDDEEPKYGLAITGVVHPEKFISAHGARPGHVLVVTKPVGTGLIGTAIKNGKATTTEVREAVRSMTALNAPASEQMVAVGGAAATDVTGFGLLGHLSELCRASGVSAEIHVSHVPLLPGALEQARAGMSPAGTTNNLQALEGNIKFAPEIDEIDRAILADPQTSGGLLISLPEERVADFRAGLGLGGLAAVIGHITAGDPGAVVVLP